MTYFYKVWWKSCRVQLLGHSTAAVSALLQGTSLRGIKRERNDAAVFCHPDVTWGSNQRLYRSIVTGDFHYSLLCLSLPASSKEEIVHREEEGRDLSPRPQKSEGPAGCRWESPTARPPARHQGTGSSFWLVTLWRKAIETCNPRVTGGICLWAVSSSTKELEELKKLDDVKTIQRLNSNFKLPKQITT